MASTILALTSCGSQVCNLPCPPTFNLPLMPPPPSWLELSRMSASYGGENDFRRHGYKINMDDLMKNFMEKSMGASKFFPGDFDENVTFGKTRKKILELTQKYENLNREFRAFKKRSAGITRICEKGVSFIPNEMLTKSYSTSSTTHFLSSAYISTNSASRLENSAKSSVKKSFQSISFNTHGSDHDVGTFSTNIDKLSLSTAEDKGVIVGPSVSTKNEKKNDVNTFSGVSGISPVLEIILFALLALVTGMVLIGITVYLVKKKLNGKLFSGQSESKNGRNCHTQKATLNDDNHIVRSNSFEIKSNNFAAPSLTKFNKSKKSLRFSLSNVDINGSKSSRINVNNFIRKISPTGPGNFVTSCVGGFAQLRNKNIQQNPLANNIEEMFPSLSSFKTQRWTDIKNNVAATNGSNHVKNCGDQDVIASLIRRPNSSVSYDEINEDEIVDNENEIYHRLDPSKMYYSMTRIKQYQTSINGNLHQNDCHKENTSSLIDSSSSKSSKNYKSISSHKSSNSSHSYLSPQENGTLLTNVEDRLLTSEESTSNNSSPGIDSPEYFILSPTGDTKQSDGPSSQTYVTPDILRRHHNLPNGNMAAIISDDIDKVITPIPSPVHQIRLMSLEMQPRVIIENDILYNQTVTDLPKCASNRQIKLSKNMTCSHV